jgi:hypothetical protein
MARLRRFAATARRARARRFAAALASGVAVFVGSTSSAFACPVCFGAEETALIDGSRLGVLVLLAITLVVQGSFAAFFLYLRKRAKRIADADLDEEWSELQKSPRTS